MNALIGLVLSLIGFLVTLYIQKKKLQGIPLACPRAIKHCDAVTSSKYSTLFGTPLEKLGSAYYKALAGVFFLLVVGIQLPVLPLLIMTGFGVLFSLYLLSIQAFIIRAWCLWCLMSFVCALAVFFVVLCM